MEIINEFKSKREKTKNKTFTMYPSIFEKLKLIAEVCHMNNSETLEMLINDEFTRMKNGE